MIPINYLSRHDAVRLLAAAKFAGVPDRPAVLEARQQGYDPADGQADDDATAELWRAVDQGKLEAFAYGPGGRFLKMSPEDTLSVPLLRSARGGDFTCLRPNHPFHPVAVSQFGSSLGLISLIFLRVQVEQVARLVQRRRRQAKSYSAARKPSRKHLVSSAVKKIVESGEWDPTMSVVALTQKVVQFHKWGLKVPSEDSVTRAIDQIFAETSDRRFQRTRRSLR